MPKPVPPQVPPGSGSSIAGAGGPSHGEPQGGRSRALEPRARPEPRSGARAGEPFGCPLPSHGGASSSALAGPGPFVGPALRVRRRRNRHLNHREHPSHRRRLFPESHGRVVLEHLVGHVPRNALCDLVGRGLTQQIVHGAPQAAVLRSWGARPARGRPAV